MRKNSLKNICHAERVSAETLKKLIKKELEVSGVKTKFEFVIFKVV
jgi:hypothetical protein